MGKQKGKRFSETSKNRNYFGFIFIFLIFIIGIIFLFFYTRTLWLNHLSSTESTNNEITNEATSVENIINNNTTSQSPYVSKSFDIANHLVVQDLFLIYENNITVIKFNLYNNSTNSQDVFDFTFSLLDESGNNIISFDLSSKEMIEPNNYKEFVLIAARDVSNAYDFQISIK